MVYGSEGTLCGPRSSGFVGGVDDVLPQGIEAASDTVPEDLSALLIEAADETCHLRDFLPVDDQTWLEGVKPEGKA